MLHYPAMLIQLGFFVSSVSAVLGGTIDTSDSYIKIVKHNGRRDYGREIPSAVYGSSQFNGSPNFSSKYISAPSSQIKFESGGWRPFFPYRHKLYSEYGFPEKSGVSEETSSYAGRPKAPLPITAVPYGRFGKSVGIFKSQRNFGKSNRYNGKYIAPVVGTSMKVSDGSKESSKSRYILKPGRESTIDNFYPKTGYSFKTAFDSDVEKSIRGSTAYKGNFSPSLPIKTGVYENEDKVRSSVFKKSVTGAFKDYPVLSELNNEPLYGKDTDLVESIDIKVFGDNKRNNDPRKYKEQVSNQVKRKTRPQRPVLSKGFTSFRSGFDVFDSNESLDVHSKFKALTRSKKFLPTVSVFGHADPNDEEAKYLEDKFSNLSSQLQVTPSNIESDSLKRDRDPFGFFNSEKRRLNRNQRAKLAKYTYIGDQGDDSQETRLSFTDGKRYTDSPEKYQKTTNRAQEYANNDSKLAILSYENAANYPRSNPSKTFLSNTESKNTLHKFDTKTQTYHKSQPGVATAYVNMNSGLSQESIEPLPYQIRNSDDEPKQAYISEESTEIPGILQSYGIIREQRKYSAEDRILPKKWNILKILQEFSASNRFNEIKNGNIEPVTRKEEI